MSIDPTLLEQAVKEAGNARIHPIDALLKHVADADEKSADLVRHLLEHPDLYSGPAVSRAIHAAGGPNLPYHSINSWRRREGFMLKETK